MAYTLEEQKQHRAEWVAALRSGKYKQTRKLLHDGEGYCCIGVGCEISGLDEWEETEDVFEYRYLGETGGMPKRVREYYGLRTPWGEYDLENGSPFPRLTTDNDSGVDFPTIADLIESEPKGLFEESWG